MPPQEKPAPDQGTGGSSSSKHEHEDAELPPQEEPMPNEGTGGSSSGRKPIGSEHEDEDARSAYDANPMDCDYGDDVGGGAKDEPRPLPFNSPFHLTKEFGIVEKTATFMGLPELVDAELIVPALRSSVAVQP